MVGTGRERVDGDRRRHLARPRRHRGSRGCPQSALRLVHALVDRGDGVDDDGGAGDARAGIRARRHRQHRLRRRPRLLQRVAAGAGAAGAPGTPLGLGLRRRVRRLPRRIARGAALRPGRLRARGLCPDGRVVRGVRSAVVPVAAARAARTRAAARRGAPGARRGQGQPARGAGRRPPSSILRSLLLLRRRGEHRHRVLGDLRRPDARLSARAAHHALSSSRSRRSSARSCGPAPRIVSGPSSSCRSRWSSGRS